MTNDPAASHQKPDHQTQDYQTPRYCVSGAPANIFNTSANSCFDSSFSNPSGMSDLPLVVNSSISLRSKACCFPSCVTSVTLVSDSVANSPVYESPCPVTAV